MRNRLNKSLHIEISRTGVALTSFRGWRKTAETRVMELPLSPSSPDQVTKVLEQALGMGRFSGALTTVVLSDDFARLFMVTPPRNLTRVSDCYAAAQLRFQSLYGTSPTDWKIAADWHPVQPFFACALPRSLLEALYQLAERYHLRLVTIAPRFVVSWNQWRSLLKPSAWFGVTYNDMLILAPIIQHRLHAIRSFAIPTHNWTDPYWLLEQIQRETLWLNIAKPTLIQLCGLECPPWIKEAIDGVTFEWLGSWQNSDPVASKTTMQIIAESLQ